MLHISASEISFLRQGVEQDLRADGRGRLDYRAITLESGMLLRGARRRVEARRGRISAAAHLKARGLFPLSVRHPGRHAGEHVTAAADPCKLDTCHTGHWNG